MTNLIKIIGRIFGYVSEWIWIFILIAIFSIRTATVQTYLTQIIANFLSKELNTKIEVKGVSIVNLDEIAFDGVLVNDKKNDTLAFINTVYLSINKIIPDIYHINEINLQGGVFHLSKQNSEFNFQFISNYFSSNSAGGENKLETIIDKLVLTDVDFSYSNFDAPKTKFGIDYNHLNFRNIQLEANRLTIKGDKNKAFIKKMSLDEFKSGFKLTNFTCQAEVSPKGIFTRRLNIQTEKSKIYAPYFKFLTNEYKDILSFNDKVKFQGKIFESKTSTYEISLFAPILEGMNNDITIKGTISEYVNNLKINDFSLNFGENSQVQGDFLLPNFTAPKSSFLNERIDYISVSTADIENIKLPYTVSKDTKIELAPMLKRLSYLKGKDIKLNGFEKQFVISANTLNTKLGSVEMSNGLLFTKSNDHYLFEKSTSGEYDIKIQDLELGELIQNKSIGKINGTFSFSGEAKSLNDINFTQLSGNLNEFYFDKYNYKNIHIQKGSLIDKVFSSKIDIKDDNLALVYDGFIDFNKGNHLVVSIDLSKAILENLNLGLSNGNNLTSNFKLDLKGDNLNSIKGKILLEGLIYTENNKSLKLLELIISISRTPEADHLEVVSSLGTLKLNGKIDFNTIVNDLKDHVSKILPKIIAPSPYNQKKINNSFDYEVTFKETNKLLNIIYPELNISNSSTLSGYYSSNSSESLFKFQSQKVTFKGVEFKDCNFSNTVTNDSIKAQYAISDIAFNDSLQVSNFNFDINGNSSVIKSNLGWDNSYGNSSLLTWDSNIKGIDEYEFDIKNSFISIQNNRWDINNHAFLKVKGKSIEIDQLKFQHQEKFIQLMGTLSDQDADQLNFRVNEFNLADISLFIDPKKDIQGTINAWGYISNPFNNISYSGDANISEFFIDKREVGNLFINSNWQKGGESLSLKGDLLYKSNKTFSFDGSYFFKRPTNNIDFKLMFDNTDIQFTNSFFDPSVVSGIKGNLAGKLDVQGEFENPIINGKVKLQKGEVKLALLNVNYKLSGDILCDKYGFYINNMPITDEEGNVGSVIGSAYHKLFSNWNYDIVFNLEDDLTKNSNAPSIVKPLNQFLVMNTQYNEDNIYYGKGYGTGMINIFGDEKVTDINVDLKTRTGSKIFFPFYTVSEIDNEQSFIQFKTKENSDTIQKPKLDFTGLNLKLNFNITPEAEIKLILDENTNDEITATGSGDISVALDKYDHLTLDGSFKVKKGDYNFVMRPVNEKFIIEENGTVTWTGDPYNAILDLKCYHSVNANLNEISQNLSTNNMGNQEILCYLNLTNSLLKPNISFDIVAPNTNEAGQTLLNMIKNNNDILNRQFFSLLLFKKFQSIDAQTTTASGTGSAALDLAQSQINSMLSQVSKDYKLNVALDKNAITGGNSMAVGITKGFYDDRLVFKGSVGIGTNGTTTDQTQTTNQNPLIGDMNLEYSLNESGSFKINIFNESNQNTILNNQLGLFTQGAGLQYQEDFTTLDEFKVLQYFLDVFRKKSKKKYPRKNHQNLTPIPVKVDEQESSPQE